MNTLLKVITTVIGISIIVFYINSCSKKLVSDRIKRVEVVDTTLVDSIKVLNDSLDYYRNDTAITAELFVLRYKLERIKYYNELAGKGNNIKFLRGWINRVVNE